MSSVLFVNVYQELRALMMVRRRQCAKGTSDQNWTKGVVDYIFTDASLSLFKMCCTRCSAFPAPSR